MADRESAQPPRILERLRLYRRTRRLEAELAAARERLFQLEYQRSPRTLTDADLEQMRGA